MGRAVQGAGHSKKRRAACAVVRDRAMIKLRG